MDFEPTAERRMLRDTLSRFLTDRYAIGHRNTVAYVPPFHDPDRWGELAELGVLHALLAEEHGGFGGTGFDIITVFETLGNALCPEPVLPALMASRVLAIAGADLAPLLDGSVRYAVALDGSDTVATEVDDGWVLNGHKSVVYGGGVAEFILVVARGPMGPGIYRIAADDAEIVSYGMIDGGNAAEILLDNCLAVFFTDGDALQEVRDAGALALCAEAVGAMDAGAAMLLEYLKTRQQFGRPIGDFQVLQHRMVDLMTEIEQARSITILAASRMGDAGQSRSVSMAKSLVGRTAQMVAEELIQMHGGIAMTWEYPASHYAKRLVMIDHQLGDTDHHLQRVAQNYRVV